MNSFPQFNVLSRRSFLDRSLKTSLAIALSTLADIPLTMKRALAEGSIGLNGKKVIFIWLRFGNDSLNSIIPINDVAYTGDGGSLASIRPNIGILKDPLTDYSTAGGADFPTGDPNSVYAYDKAIRLGNGFAALHPCLKFLAPVYNAGDLALIHRTAYPRQSRSHFDSQNYWENGNPNNKLSKDGIFYRTIIESGLANTAPLTGVSVQSALPLLLRGSQAAMTNLTSPTRYDLLGVPTNIGDPKASSAISAANYFPFAAKRNRELLELQYQNMSNTLQIFSGIDFTDTGNTFRDDETTDGDIAWANANGHQGYYLFPNTDNKNGGYLRPDASKNVNKRVVKQGHQSFFTNLKAAAMILNNTDAIIAGTEIGGFDTHQTEGGAAGTHADLQKVIGWSMYALRKYFSNYANKVNWDNVVVVTLSEFGRTSVENTDKGTDHAEAGAMFVAGGGVKGYGQGNATGVFGCSPGESLPWLPGPRTSSLTTCGTMFAANTAVAAGYLRRSCDYRSVLGEVIRKHLGATQDQLNRIIPGYANPAENLLGGGLSTDGVQIRGEVGIL